MVGGCGGAAKPDIVFFGEAIPWEFHAKAELLVHADLLFIVGTALAVFPFASLAGLVEPGTPRVVLNTERSDAYAHAGFQFDASGRKTDVIFEGDCQATVKQLCRLAGWEEELLQLVRESK